MTWCTVISEIVTSIHLTETYIDKERIPGMAFVISRALSSAGNLYLLLLLHCAHAASNYRVGKTQANKCPLKPNTKQAPARTSKQTNKRGQAKHNFSPLRPPSPSFSSPSSFLHSIFILLLVCLPGCGSEAADSSSQSPRGY
jgi:hypothetical protein